MPIDVNNVPVFVMVVTATSEPSEHAKTTDQETYKFFILIPTRTEDGTVNIRYDDQFARKLTFRFDRDTLEFSTNGQVKDSCALVLQSGLGGRRFDAAAAAVVRGWMRRKEVDMEVINKLWTETVRDGEQAKVSAKLKQKREA